MHRSAATWYVMLASGALAGGQAAEWLTSPLCQRYVEVEAAEESCAIVVVESGGVSGYWRTLTPRALAIA